MTLYRVNYEEYMHFEEFVEASTPEEARRQFENSISDLEPMESGVFTYDITDTEKERTTHVDSKSNNTGLGKGDKRISHK